MQVQALFIAAMEAIGATQLDEVPEASEMQKCLRHANLMLDSWSGRRFLVPAVIEENFPLVPGQSVYTIGLTKNFNTAKPVKILSAYMRDTSSVDYPVAVLDKDIYDSLDDKSFVTGRPEALYYDPGVDATFGTVKTYHIPDQAYTLFLNSQKYLTEFVNLTDVVKLDPAYYLAVVYNLAVLIWRPMGRTGPVPADVMKQANDSLKTLEKINHRLPVARIDVPGGVSAPVSNPLTGDWMA